MHVKDARWKSDFDCKLCGLVNTVGVPQFAVAECKMTSEIKYTAMGNVVGVCQNCGEHEKFEGDRAVPRWVFLRLQHEHQQDRMKVR